MKWKWYRFTSDSEDYRPVVFPPPGPFWCTGYNAFDHAVIVAYLPPDSRLADYWPEAQCIDVEDKEEIVFTDRFEKPEWWN